MGGRADLYVGFFEQALNLLRPGAALGFICADRWMRNSYGKSLRQMIQSGDFSVETTISLHDVDCFEAAVSAYPAITSIRRADRQGNGVVVTTGSEFSPGQAAAVTRFIESSSQHQVGPGWRGARLDQWFGGDMWPEGSPEELAALKDLERRFEPLEDVLKLTRTGIGVATGADAVFITSNPSLVEADRLLPLVMSNHITDGVLRWEPTFLVNPWDDKRLVDLDRYPKLATYFGEHREQLADRHTARKNPTNWFRTIDRVNGWLTNTPKILLSDMKMRITPVVEPGGLYPHHNLYWIVSQRWPIESLAGLLLSDTANLFVKSYCVKMRGGTLRFQTQYLRQIRLPDPSKLTADTLRHLADAYGEQNIEMANELADKVYGGTIANERTGTSSSFTASPLLQLLS